MRDDLQWDAADEERRQRVPGENEDSIAEANDDEFDDDDEDMDDEDEEDEDESR
jgi:hypothetical protein